ncbi:sterol carrier family protein [Canibacter zhoujuaniae]|uniref:sterol carrier family protein n=1 Tax=Canibacter zhoujuaniae TaxID=2708343 RepID=UPI0014238F55|nr:sterol carrier family protein [Canibacter zhoujuaniae]
MAKKRKIDPVEGRKVLDSYRDRIASGELVDRSTVATATRYLLEELALIAPGNSVEVRVPPYGAVQCVPGPKHHRGTPPNVIELSPHSWFLLATGQKTWAELLAAGEINASGTRADLSKLLPIMTLK